MSDDDIPKVTLTLYRYQLECIRDVLEAVSDSEADVDLDLDFWHSLDAVKSALGDPVTK